MWDAGRLHELGAIESGYARSCGALGHEGAIWLSLSVGQWLLWHLRNWKILRTKVWVDVVAVIVLLVVPLVVPLRSAAAAAAAAAAAVQQAWEAEAPAQRGI